MIKEVFPYRLPLVRPWHGARATLDVRIGALLRLRDEEGWEGWGDCAPLPSRPEPASVIEALAQWACRPASADRELLPPEARWAIEVALVDLAARRAGKPLWRHLGGSCDEIALNAALGPLDEELPGRLRKAAAAGFSCAKIKVGLHPVAEEIARLSALPFFLPLRLDANRAWSDADALRFLSAVRDLPIEAIEEPLARPTLEKLAQLQARLPFALALDESLPALDWQAAIRSRAIHRLVLKPARLGGIAATRRIAEVARAAGCEVVLTSVVDSAVGLTAVAHLAAALAPDVAHGLDTARWLAQDVALPPPIRDGRLRLKEAPGLGLLPPLPLPR